jgi:hypothetical protein
MSIIKTITQHNNKFSIGREPGVSSYDEEHRGGIQPEVYKNLIKYEIVETIATLNLGEIVDLLGYEYMKNHTIKTTNFSDLKIVKIENNIAVLQNGSIEIEYDFNLRDIPGRKLISSDLRIAKKV